MESAIVRTHADGADGGGDEPGGEVGVDLLPADAKATVRVLVVDDDRTLRESCGNVLRVEGYDVTLCGRGQEAYELLQRRGFDVVLLDLNVTQVSGLELLELCLKTKPDTVVIVTTGNASVSSSIEALQAGAWDYLPKPYSASHLQVLLGRAAHSVLLARETRAHETRLQGKYGHSDKVTVLGVSPAFRGVIELSRRVAATDASVFITGESGTGKEQIAQFIHHHSRRARRELVAVNCAALPEPLLESEMFGHVKGAFTGAVRDKVGLLEVANGGTLFLDELTEMSQAIQAKLLRAIQDGVVRRVGSNSMDALVNVRFIAATNRDPQQSVEEGVLRKDLYYRLRVVPIRIPPLRERPEDIPVLAEHFLNVYWKRHRPGRNAMPHFSPAAVRELQHRAWVGNVRELQNVIEHAVVLVEPGWEIQPGDLPSADDGPAVPFAAVPSFDGTSEEPYHVARDRILSEFERSYLTRLVERAGGNMSQAARMAGVDRTTLYRLMEKHGVQRDTIITARR